MTFDYYGYGNAFLVVDILMGIKSILSASEYTTLIVIIATSAFVYVVVSKSLGGKPHEVLTYFILVALGTSLVFGKKMDIIVHDKLPGLPTLTATGIPIIIGMPLVATNAIGWQITEWYETYMSSALASGLRMSQGAPFAASSRVLRDMKDIRFTDPNINNYLNSYLRDCKLPELYQDPSRLKSWFSSKDIMAAIESTDTLLTTQKSPRIIRTCKDAYSEIKTMIMGPDKQWSVSDWLNKNLVTGNAASASAVQGSLGSILSNSQVMDAITGKISNGQYSSEQYVLGALMAPKITNAINIAALRTGASSVVSAVNTAQARRSQSTGWEVAAILFQDIAGYFFSAMNLLVLGLSPIILLGIFIPKFGTKVVSSFIKVLVWLMLWWPALALVNHISTGYLFQGIQASAFADLTSTTAWDVGMPTMLSGFGSSASVAAGFLATMVPMILWGIISGSGQAFTSALMAASGKADAMTAARNIASGNIRMDEIGYNNTSANKFDTTTSQRTGEEGSYQYHTDGQHSHVNQFAGDTIKQGDKDVTVMDSRKITTSEDNTVTKGTSVDKQHRQQRQEAITDSAAHVDSFFDSLSKNNAFNSKEAVGNAITDGKSAAAALITGHMLSSKQQSMSALENNISAELSARIYKGIGGGKADQQQALQGQIAAHLRGEKGATGKLNSTLDNLIGDSNARKGIDSLLSGVTSFLLGGAEAGVGLKAGGSITGKGGSSHSNTRVDGSDNKTSITETDSENRHTSEDLSRVFSAVSNFLSQSSGSNTLARALQAIYGTGTNLSDMSSDKDAFGHKDEVYTTLTTIDKKGTEQLRRQLEGRGGDTLDDARERIISKGDDLKQQHQESYKDEKEKVEKAAGKAGDDRIALQDKNDQSIDAAAAEGKQRQKDIAGKIDEGKAKLTPGMSQKTIETQDESNDIAIKAGEGLDNLKEINLGTAGVAKPVGLIQLDQNDADSRETLYSLTQNGQERLVYFSSSSHGEDQVISINEVTSSNPELKAIAGQHLEEQTRDARHLMNPIGASLFNAAGGLMNVIPGVDFGKYITPGEGGSTGEIDGGFNSTQIGYIDSNSQLHLSGEQTSLQSVIQHIGDKNAPPEIGPTSSHSLNLLPGETSASSARAEPGTPKISG